MRISHIFCVRIRYMNKGGVMVFTISSKIIECRGDFRYLLVRDKYIS